MLPISTLSASTATVSLTISLLRSEQAGRNHEHGEGRHRLNDGKTRDDRGWTVGFKREDPER
jgi:hypothetical protein